MNKPKEVVPLLHPNKMPLINGKPDNKSKSTEIDLSSMRKRSYDNFEEPYDPFKNRNVENPTSNMDTMVHLLKGNVGTGILAMPEAFKNSGLIIGTFGTFLVGAICVYTMNLLVNCSQILCVRNKVPSMSFSQVAIAAFNDGPPFMKKIAKFTATMIDVFLCIAQLGFCSVYFVFIAKNLKHVLEQWFEFEFSVQTYIAFLLLPMILLNWIRNLSLLAKYEFFANIFMGVGLGIIYYFCLVDFDPAEMKERKMFASWSQLPLWFGTAIYSFEGIGVVLPLENKMKRPQDFGGLNGVLTRSMILVGALYIVTGLAGYLRYGEMVEGSITLNLPTNNYLADGVILVMAISIFFTYAIPFFVPVDIIMPSIKKRFGAKVWTFAELSLRTVLVLLTFGVAEVVPNLGALISLVGAVCSGTLAFIFPPIINIGANYEIGYGKYYWKLLKDLLLVFFGLIGFVTGTYMSLSEIISSEH